MSALKPGLCRATVRGVADVIVMVDRNGNGGITADEVASFCYHRSSLITDARPLIVLDLERPGEFVASLQDAISMMSKSGPNHHRLTELARQIEAQTQPARIPEPNWDGKVLAHTESNPTRREFVRFGGRVDTRLANWYDRNSFGSTKWAELIDPVLIREGWES